MTTDIAPLKQQLKRLKNRAVQLKMDLHDLSEELPLHYERIPEIAQRTYDTYRQINDLQQRIKTLEATP